MNHMISAEIVDQIFDYDIIQFINTLLILY